MSKIYVKHECKTLEEVNALALDSAGKEIDAYVFAPTGEVAYWYPEEWSYQDGYGGDNIRFPLSEGQTVTVLVGEEAEEETSRRRASMSGYHPIDPEDANAWRGHGYEIHTRLTTAWANA